MNIEEVLKNRKSIRAYKNEIIQEADLQKILDAAIISPSAKNQQPWKYIIVTGDIKQEIAKKLTEAIGHPNPTSKSISECSHLILVYNTIDEYFSHMSIGASIENMLLMATSLNIGSLWIGYIRKIEDYINNITKEEGELISAIALGIADEEPPARPRKNKEEIVKYLNI